MTKAHGGTGSWPTDILKATMRGFRKQRICEIIEASARSQNAGKEGEQITANAGHHPCSARTAVDAKMLIREEGSPRGARDAIDACEARCDRATNLSVKHG